MRTTDIQGISATTLFSGEGRENLTKEVYGTSIEKYVEHFQTYNLPKHVDLADFGGYDGKTCVQLKLALYDHHITTHGFDILPETPNMYYDTYTQSDLRSIAIENEFDLSIMRYVLPWNTQTAQKKIIQNAVNATKYCTLIEHIGPVQEMAEDFREMNQTLFAENTEQNEVNPLTRPIHQFNSPDEIEMILDEQQQKYKRIFTQTLPSIAPIFCEKYHLDNKNQERVYQLFKPFTQFERVIWAVE